VVGDRTVVVMVTRVVLEPDGVEVQRRSQIQDVRIGALQQVRNTQLRAMRERETE